MNVGQNAAIGDRYISEQLVQLFVVLDGQGNVTRHDTGLFIVSCGVAGQFQDFGAQVFQHGRQVDWGTGTHSRCVLALAKVTADTTNRELQTGLGRGGG